MMIWKALDAQVLLYKIPCTVLVLNLVEERCFMIIYSYAYNLDMLCAVND